MWSLQCPAILLTSVPAVMTRTMLQFAQPTRPTSPARLLNILLTPYLPGAASPVVCRLALLPRIMKTSLTEVNFTFVVSFNL